MDRLTEGQRICLRLVLQHKSSKDIARELGISPHTVDQRIRLAMQTLGVSNRVEAARKLASIEHSDAYQPSVYQSATLALSVVEDTIGSSSTQENGAPEHQKSVVVSEEQSSFEAGRPPSKWFPIPFPTSKGQSNDLGMSARLVWVLLIAILAVLSFGGLLAGLDALARLL